MKPLSGHRVPQLIQSRLDKLTPQFSQLPPPHSRRLAIAGHTAGWVASKAQEAIKGCPGVHTDPDTSAIHITTTEGAHVMSLQAVLDTLAQALHQAGCLKGWRNEPIDVMVGGQRLATLERAAMRPLGLLTRAVHLNAWSASGGLWVARRADDKPTDPGCWDTAVGGLVSAGEGLDLALVRESAEEAGLTPSDLAQRTPLRTVAQVARRIPEGYQVEEVLVADCVLPEQVVPVNQDGEVSAFECVSLPELLDRLAAGVFTMEAELAILDSLRCQLTGDGVAIDSRGGSV